MHLEELARGPGTIIPGDLPWLLLAKLHLLHETSARQQHRLLGLTPGRLPTSHLVEAQHDILPTPSRLSKTLRETC